MRNRRGEMSQLLLVLVQIIMLGLIMGMVYLYAAAHTDSSAYFQEFYTKDMSLLSELLVASPGITTMTYDNIRNDQPLIFEFSKSIVEVIIKKENTKRGGISMQRDYGVYPRLTTPYNIIDTPYFLSFVKVGNHFAIQEASGYLRRCTLSNTAISAEELKVKLIKQVRGVVQENTQILTGVHETISIGTKKISLFEENPNVVFTVDMQEGPNDVMINYNKNSLPADNQYLACLLKGQLEAFSGTLFSVKKEGVGGTQDTIDINLDIIQETLDDGSLPLSDREIGRIIGRALVVYAR